jgi:iron complex transport system substrate-binding protein
MNIAHGVLWRLIGMGLALCAGAGPAAAGPPQRIVSLNLCTDQLLGELVAHERIAAISFLGIDRTLSASARELAGLKLIRGSAEEVLQLKPDLVVAGEYTTGATVDLLRRLGQKVLVVPLAADFEGMRMTIRMIAAEVEEPAKGEDIIAAFDERLSAARSVVTSKPTAIAYQVNSLVSGPDSLLDAALDAAGYRNLAREARLGPAGRMPLEDLVTAPPDLIVLANGPDDFQTVLADNLRHPALAALLKTRPSVRLPMPYWMCATPKIAEAVEILASMKRTGFAAARALP